MLMSEMRSVGNKGCLRHILMPEAAATLGRVHTSSVWQSPGDWIVTQHNGVEVVVLFRNGTRIHLEGIEGDVNAYRAKLCTKRCSQVTCQFNT